MWTKEQCNLFFKKTLGLELTDEELNEALSYFKSRNLSPNSSHGDWNLAFTPLKIIHLVNFTLAKTKNKLQDKRFKKVSEEIFPTIYFTLLLLKQGYGKHLIVSKDAPDIALIPVNDLKNRKNNTIKAIPLECIFLPPEAIDQDNSEDNSQKIANLIIKKKFTKRFYPQTILLVTINKPEMQLNIAEISNRLLEIKNQPYDQIWLFCGVGEQVIILSQLCPKLQIINFNIQQELIPLLY